MSDLVPNWNKKKDSQDDEAEDKKVSRAGAPDFMQGKKKEDSTAADKEADRMGAPDFMQAKKTEASTAADKATGHMGAPDWMHSKNSSVEVEQESEESLAEHTVVSGDTLSGIALKYYGSAARDKWMAIYEANKETIGENPNLIRVGQVFQIPKLED